MRCRYLTPPKPPIAWNSYVYVFIYLQDASYMNSQQHEACALLCHFKTAPLSLKLYRQDGWLISGDVDLLLNVVRWTTDQIPLHSYNEKKMTLDKIQNDFIQNLNCSLNIWFLQFNPKIYNCQLSNILCYSCPGNFHTPIHLYLQGGR